MRTIAEVRAYLQQKEKRVEHAEAAIQKLLEHGFLNDQSFADSYVRSKINTLLKGPLLLKQELLQKGISNTMAEQAVAQFSVEKQVEKLSIWLENQQNKNRRDSAAAFKQRLTNRLIGKGFAHSVIGQAFETIEVNQDNDEEWEALCYQAQKLERKYSARFRAREYEQKMKQALYRKGFALDLIMKYLKQNGE